MGKIYDINGFGKKLMVSSRSANNVPDKYLSLSRNARIYDGGIGPRLGKSVVFESEDGGVNKGGFSLGGELYQITNKKLYHINTETGVRTEKGELSHDSVVDTVTYQFPKGAFSSAGSITQIENSFVNQFIDSERAEKIAPKQFRLAYKIDIIHTISGLNGTEGSYTFSGNVVTFTNNVPDTPVFFRYGAIRGIGAVRYFKESNLLGLYTPDKSIRVGTFVLPVDLRLKPFPAVAIHPPYGGVAGSSGHYDAGKYYLYDGEWCVFGDEQSPFSLTYDYGEYANGQNTIIVADGQQTYSFDGTTLSVVSVPNNNGIIEYALGRTFIASGNVLFVSTPITYSSPEKAYDFTGAGSQNIQYGTKITGLKATLNGLYVFCENSVEKITANSLQNIAGSATLISTVLSKSSPALSNQLIVTTGDKILWISKQLNIQTIGYTPGVEGSQVGELSSRPIISIKELLKSISDVQPTASAWYNEKDKTVNFSVRRTGYNYNNYVIVYDIVNDTWNVDTQKNYTFVVSVNGDYYGFSDINDSIYKDTDGYSDAGMPIEFRIVTNNFALGTYTQKLFDGFYVFGATGPFTEIEIDAIVDMDIVFNDKISGQGTINTLGDIGSEIGGSDIGDGEPYEQKLSPFYMRADAGRIYYSGTSLQLEIRSSSLNQDFIVDKLGFSATVLNFTDINNKF